MERILHTGDVMQGTCSLNRLNPALKIKKREKTMKTSVPSKRRSFCVVFAPSGPVCPSLLAWPGLFPCCLPKNPTGGGGLGTDKPRDRSPPTLQPDSCGPIKSNSSQVFLVMTHAQKAPLPLGLFLENLELFKFYSPTTSNPGRKQ